MTVYFDKKQLIFLIWMWWRFAFSQCPSAKLCNKACRFQVELPMEAYCKSYHGSFSCFQQHCKVVTFWTNPTSFPGKESPVANCPVSKRHAPVNEAKQSRTSIRKAANRLDRAMYSKTYCLRLTFCLSDHLTCKFRWNHRTGSVVCVHFVRQRCSYEMCNNIIKIIL